MDTPKPTCWRCVAEAPDEPSEPCLRSYGSNLYRLVEGIEYHSVIVPATSNQSVRAAHTNGTGGREALLLGVARLSTEW
jgi:hypothetical protein